MRQLTATLEAAQKQPSRTPCVSVRAVNKNNGVIRQKWARLYTGADEDYHHALTVPADGSLIRVKVTPVSDSRKIYRQRIVEPGPGSAFSQWVYTGQYDAVVITAASGNAEVSIIWINADREIKRLKSTDNGATWGSPETIDTLPTTEIHGVAASYKPNGDLAIFFAEYSTLYVKKCVGGQWQAKTSWDKITDVLSGVGCVYDGDWDLLVTGNDTAGNPRAWSLAFGDGGEVAAGTWSALKEVASAPAASGFVFKQPFLDKTDACCCLFIESYSGIEAYSRPFRSYIVPGTHYFEGLWREPVPFNLTSEYGLAMAHHGDYGWLSSPGGVWRTPVNEQVIDVTDDVIAVRQETGKLKGNLVVALMNDDGRYAHPGQNGLEMLDKGCQIEFSPGYITPAGKEYSEGQYYTIESCEHTNAGGKASLIISAADGWKALENWQARTQFRWNKNTGDFSVKDIIAGVLARAGLKLAVITQSPAIGSFYPDFTLNPGSNGLETIRKLLTFVPDVILIEGNTAFLLNPQPDDTALYSFGTQHAIMESRYRQQLQEINRVQVEGRDTVTGDMILVDSFSEGGAVDFGGRRGHITDKNLGTVAEAVQRGAALLRQSEMEADENSITVPVNCGQQLYDVVAVTDIPAELSAQNKRINGMTLVYGPARGEYLQRLKLGRV